MPDYAKILKFNPNHASDGKFTSKSAANHAASAAGFKTVSADTEGNKNVHLLGGRGTGSTPGDKVGEHLDAAAKSMEAAGYKIVGRDKRSFGFKHPNGSFGNVEHSAENQSLYGDITFTPPKKSKTLSPEKTKALEDFKSHVLRHNDQTKTPDSALRDSEKLLNAAYDKAKAAGFTPKQLRDAAYKVRGLTPPVVRYGKK